MVAFVRDIVYDLLSLLTFSADVIWQLLYWKVSNSLILVRLYPNSGYEFVLVDRRAKIESGQRTTSFSFLLNEKRGVIGRALSSIPQGYREAVFMGGQLSKSLSCDNLHIAYSWSTSLHRSDRSTRRIRPLR